MSHAIAVLPTDVGFLELGRHASDFDLALNGFLAGYSGATLADYRRDLKVFWQWCTSHDLDPMQAKRPHLELYLRYLEQTGWAASTRSRRFGVVKGFYAKAVLDEILDKDPTVAIKRPKVNKKEQRRTYLTALEFGVVLAAARKYGVMAHALVALLGLRGLRIAEACRLDVEHVTVHTAGYDMITVLRKGGHHETMVLPIPAARAVRAAIDGRTTGPVLLNKWGLRMNRGNATVLLRNVARSAAVHTDWSPHSLRRTFVSTMLDTGVPLRDAQLAAGHASPNTTVLYHMTGANPDRDAAHRLAAFVSGIAG